MKNSNNKKIVSLVISVLIIIAVALFGGKDALYSLLMDNQSKVETQADKKQDKETQDADENKEEVSYKFRNANLLQEHFEKHGKEMGFSSAKDYEKAASKVVTDKKALHKLEAEDGDDVYYLESTNEFVIVSKDGYLRTYFNPNDGIRYYNRQ